MNQKSFSGFSSTIFWVTLSVGSFVLVTTYLKEIATALHARNAIECIRLANELRVPTEFKEKAGCAIAKPKANS